MRLFRALPISLAVLGVAASTASADYTAVAPSPSDKSIQPATSIAGVKLGMSYADALKAWGPGSTCAQDDAAYALANPGKTIDRTASNDDCSWLGNDSSGHGSIAMLNGKVRSVQIFAAQSSPGHPTTKGSIAQIVLKKGKYKIKTGVSMSVIYKAFPKAQDNGGGPTLSKGGRTMTFSSSASHLYSIGLYYPGDI